MLTYNMTANKNNFLIWLYFLLLVSCGSDNDENIVTEPRGEVPVLKSFVFYCDDNPIQLTEDVKGEIIGDSIVDCWVPNIMSSKELIPYAEHNGKSIKFDDVPWDNGISKYDFKKPVKMTIENGDKLKDYTIYVHSYTGLPIIWIETEGRKEIDSKEIYQQASFKLVDNVRTRAAGDVVEDSVSIKGRGNSTWNNFPKKPYRLKFDKKIPLLDEPKDKAWVLLSNYGDKSMLRIQTAFYMGKISNLDYTPRAHFVELMLNGRYHGTYLLSDKIKISEHRVNVGKDGFLLEIDGMEKLLSESDSRFFSVKHISNVVNIKDPEVEYDDENFEYAKGYITKIDSVLYSDSFLDPQEGWQKYMDIESFVDWYLINEIAKCNDANFMSSCYMNFKKDGKLKMGPVWDFDTSFGNLYYPKSANNYYGDVKGFHVLGGAEWYTRLFEDPVFVKRVKERFNYFYSWKDDIMREINANAMYLKYAVQENEKRWHTLYAYNYPNNDIWGSYNNEVQYLKEWLNARFEWLKTEFDKM